MEKASNDAQSLQRTPQHPKHFGDFNRQVTLKGNVKAAAIQPFIFSATTSSPAQVKVVQQDTKTTKKRIDVGPMDLQNLNTIGYKLDSTQVWVLDGSGILSMHT